MRILVTGGAGFIGSHLVDRLVRNNHDVRVLDNLFRGKLINLQNHLDGQHIEFIEQDIRDYDGLKSACQGSEVVFHLAAQSNVLGAVENIDYSFSTNVIGTFNLLKACKEQGVRRVIFSSSREAYGEASELPVHEQHPLNSKNSYGASKVAGEKYCQVFQNSAELEVVILRFANVYGLRDFDRVIPIFSEKIQQGRAIEIYGGEQVIDFVSIPTVVEVLSQSITNQAALEGPTNVGSGQGRTLFELAEKLIQIHERKTDVKVQPARSVEVVKFTADIQRLKQIFELKFNTDPLYHLKEMINSKKNHKNTK